MAISPVENNRIIMGNLADSIESYLRRLVALSVCGYLEIKRKELAGKFHCAASQVNYVLETRFTLEKGYLVESRRGGKGYLRIRKVNTDGAHEPGRILQDLGSGPVSSGQAKAIIEKLSEGKHISIRESKIIEAALACCSAPGDRQLQDELRGCLLRRMITVLLYQS